MTRPVPSAGRTVASACWLPPDLREIVDALPGGSTPFVRRYEHDNRQVEVMFERLSAAALEQVAGFLKRRRREVLARRSVRDIVDLLDRAAALWLDPSYPPRRDAIAEIATITSFSPQMVAHAIDEEQVSSRGPHLLEALRSELGDPEVLDGFRPNRRLGGFSRAFGPELVGAIFSSNIPALPHLEIMRSLLVKAACVGRVSAGEPIFLRRYVETLAELDPEIASCLAVIYWERGDEDAEAAFLRSIDHLVAYGGEAQTSRLLSLRPPGLEATWHGHRLGFAYVTREALASGQDVRKLARSVSYDFTIFDGFACLCPQVCFVEEGGDVSPAELARLCAEEMARLCEELPPRALDLAEASRKHTFRQLCLMSSTMEVVAAPEDCSYIVALEAMERFEPSCGERLVRIAPVAGPADLDAARRIAAAPSSTVRRHRRRRLRRAAPRAARDPGLLGRHADRAARHHGPPVDDVAPRRRAVSGPHGHLVRPRGHRAGAAARARR